MNEGLRMDVVQLTVRGRRSGQPRSTPVGLFERDGHRYLFGVYGETNWVRNLRAAGEAVITGHGRREAMGAVELTPDEAGPILQSYLRSPDLGPALRRYFSVGPDASLSAFIGEARRRPVFELRPSGSEVAPTS